MVLERAKNVNNVIYFFLEFQNVLDFKLAFSLELAIMTNLREPEEHS